MANVTILMCLALNIFCWTPERGLSDDNIQSQISMNQIRFNRRRRHSNNALTTTNDQASTWDGVDSETSSWAVTSLPPPPPKHAESNTSLFWLFRGIPRNSQNNDVLDSNGTTEDVKNIITDSDVTEVGSSTSQMHLPLNEREQMNVSVLTNDPNMNETTSFSYEYDDITSSPGNISTPSPMASENVTVNSRPYISTESKNKESVFTLQPVDDVWYVCHGITGTIIETIGVIGNIMCITVLSHPDMRSSTGILLRSLAFYDILVLTSYFFLISLQQIFKYTVSHDSFTKNFHNPSYPVWFSLASIAFMGSSYTTVIISVERFLVVTFPLRACIWCTETRAKLAVGLVFLSSVLYNIPRYMVFNVQTVWDEESQKTVIKQSKTEFSKSIFYVQTYSVTMNIITKVFLPLAVLTTCSCLMLRAVLRKKRVGRVLQQSAVGSNHSRFTAMTTAVMTFSLMSLLTGAAEVVLLRIHHTQFSEADACEMVCAAMSAVSELMAILNSGINFLLFCFFGSKFREVFRKSFCSKKYKYPIGSALGKDQSEFGKTSGTTGSSRSTQTSSFVSEHP